MRRSALFCLSIFFTLSNFLGASTIESFTFSGRLGSASGVSLSGTAFVTMSAALYEQQSGGTSLYLQTYSSVEVTNGFFSIEIGPALPTLSMAPYLDLTVQGQTLTPRQKLIIMPLAIEAADAQTAQFATEAQTALSANEAQDSQTLQGSTPEDLRAGILNDLGANLSSSGGVGLSVESISAGSIFAQTGTITNLSTNQINSPNIEAGTVDAVQLMGDGAAITNVWHEGDNLSAPEATVQILTAPTLNSQTATITLLNANNMEANTINAGTVEATQFIGDGSGLTGVGESHLLHSGNSSIEIDTTTTGIGEHIHVSVDGVESMFITSTGVGVFHASPSVAMDVAGTVAADFFVGDGSGLSGVFLQGEPISATEVHAPVLSDGTATLSGGSLVINQVDASGTVTAAAFVGDGSGLSGVLIAGDDISTGMLEATTISDGIAEISGGNLHVGNIHSSGTVTAVTYYGDGSNLTGLPSSPGSAVGTTGVLFDSIYISRSSSNTLIGTRARTHVNLGINSQTGLAGQDYHHATVGGGSFNTASEDWATVAGGFENTASGHKAVVGGGYLNTASGSNSTVGGGQNNKAFGGSSTVAGGHNNQALHVWSTVGGGQDNKAKQLHSTVSGGKFNIASGVNSAIPGGSGLILSGTGSMGFRGGDNSSQITRKVSNTIYFMETALCVGEDSSSCAESAYTSGIIYSSGIQTSGGVTAATFYGDGSQLQNVIHPGDALNTNSTITMNAASGVKLLIDAGIPTVANDPKIAVVADTGRFGSVTIFSVDEEGDVFADDLDVDEVKISGGIRHSSSTQYGVLSHTHVNLGTLSSTGDPNTGVGYISIAGGQGNVASQEFASVGAGQRNTASGLASRIGGGEQNLASGDHTFIGGGGINEALGTFSSVVGGFLNTASGSAALVAGGSENVAGGENSSVVAGYQNHSKGLDSFIGGGRQNSASGAGSMVGAGYSNTVSGTDSVILAGNSNLILGERSIIPGGSQLTLLANDSFAFNGLNSSQTIGTEQTGAAIFMVSRFGVGTTSPITSALMDIAGDLNVDGQILQNGSPISSPFIQSSTNIVYTSGNMGLMVSNPDEKLVVGGKVRLEPTTDTHSLDGTLRFSGEIFEARLDGEWVDIRTQPTAASSNSTDRIAPVVPIGSFFPSTQQNLPEGFSQSHLSITSTLSLVQLVDSQKAGDDLIPYSASMLSRTSDPISGFTPFQDSIEIPNHVISRTAFPDTFSNTANNLVFDSGFIYTVFGNVGGSDSNEVYAYDTTSDSWSFLTTAENFSGRKNNGAATLHGFLYSFGGQIEGSITDETLVYDPVQGWSSGPSLPKAAQQLEAVVAGDTIFLVGGHDDTTDMHELYAWETSKSQSWTSLATMNVGRTQHCAVEFQGQIHVIGGVDGGNALQSREVYDLAGNTWNQFNDLPETINSHKCVALGDRIYIIGGANTARVLEFDPVSQNFTYLETYPETLHFPVMASDGVETYILSANGSTNFRGFLPGATLYSHRNDTGGKGAELGESIAVLDVSTSPLEGFTHFGDKLTTTTGTDFFLHFRDATPMVSLVGIYDDFRDEDGDSGLFVGNTSNDVKIRSSGKDIIEVGNTGKVSFFSEQVEMDGLVTLSPTTLDSVENGSIRWTGNDLELKKDGAWESLSTAKVSEIKDNDGDTLIITDDGNDPDFIDFQVNGTVAMTINSDSNVGIGTITPMEKLEVNGAILIGNTGLSNAGAIRFDGSNFEGFDGGSWLNLSSGGGSAGASGTGENSFIGAGVNNSAVSTNAFVGAGMANSASNADSAVVGGNTNSASADRSFVGGGYNNQVNGVESSIVGGNTNQISGALAAIVGGFDNFAGGSESFVGGGKGNSANNDYSSVAGGKWNTANANYTFIGGGLQNTVVATSAFVGAGDFNEASGGWSSVVGGKNNTAQADYSTVGGGGANHASGPHSTIAGGDGNKAQGINAFVGGGLKNTASGLDSLVVAGQENQATAEWSSVVGGLQNTGTGSFSFVGGGQQNQVSSTSTFIGGGEQNSVSGAYSSILGGKNNAVGGQLSVIPGGENLTVNSNKTFAFNGSANSVIVSDPYSRGVFYVDHFSINTESTFATFEVSSIDETDAMIVRDGLGGVDFIIDAGGRVGIGTDTAHEALHVIGSGEFTEGLNVGFDSGNPVADRLSLGDASFHLDLTTTTTPKITYDTDDYTTYDRTNNIYQWYSGGSELARLDSSGNMSIGVTGTFGKLTVDGDLISIYRAAAAGEARYHLYNGGGTAGWMFGQPTGTDHGFTISKDVAGNITDYLHISESSGNVGIGTTSPAGLLHVKGTADPQVRFEAPAGNSISFRFDHGGSTDWLIGSRDTVDTPHNRFGIYDNSIIERFTILNGGNVGIGTNNPTTKLEVNGEVKATSLTIGDGSTKMTTSSAFSVRKSAIQTITNDTVTDVTWETEVFDQGNDFDLTNNYYVAPVTGIYHFDTTINWLPGGSAGLVTYIAVNNTSVLTNRHFASSSNQTSGPAGITIKLNAGDQVDVMVYQITGADREISSGNVESYFSGHLVVQTE